RGPVRSVVVGHRKFEFTVCGVVVDIALSTRLQRALPALRLGLGCTRAARARRAFWVAGEAPRPLRPRHGRKRQQQHGGGGENASPRTAPEYVAAHLLSSP